MMCRHILSNCHMLLALSIAKKKSRYPVLPHHPILHHITPQASTMFSVMDTLITSEVWSHHL